MVQYIPPPEPRYILPPLLACLPTAFVSSRPPPALLPLLSPILRQRIHLLSSPSTTTPSSGSWLPLLCWEQALAQDLVDLVSESDAFELHPISGEIEIGSIEPLKYRRLDEETLQARIAASETGLTVLVLWCNDDLDAAGTKWCVTEVRPYDDRDGIDSGHWCSSIAEAEEQANQRAFDEAVREDNQGTATAAQDNEPTPTNEDDDYWAQYDSMPAETPAEDPVPPDRNTDQPGRERSASEAEYFSRYRDVQPEMDNDDPSQDKEAIGHSTLNGNVVVPSSQRDSALPRQQMGDPLTTAQTTVRRPENELSHPTAESPPSGNEAVIRLEHMADTQSIADPAVKAHVGTSIKSLHRLCKGTGMTTPEFEDLVQTELQTLSMLDED